jgi:hypothetical protein
MTRGATIVFFALALCAVSHAADRRILHAIREAEGVKDPARRGPAGELGFYRITPGVWVQHTSAAFDRAASDHLLEERIAIRHLDWLERELVRGGHVPTPFRLALAWNAGLEGSNRAPASAVDYARRVANLVEVAP